MTRNSKDVPYEAAQLFVTHLKTALAQSQLDTLQRNVRAAVTTFDMMHIQEPIGMPAERKRLVLQDGTGQLLVCDEYYPSDGRVHVLNMSLFGTFDERTMRLEVRKVAFDVDEILYCENDWPDDMGEFSLDAVNAYFQ